MYKNLCNLSKIIPGVVGIMSHKKIHVTYFIFSYAANEQ